MLFRSGDEAARMALAGALSQQAVLHVVKAPEVCHSLQLGGPPQDSCPEVYKSAYQAQLQKAQETLAQPRKALYRNSNSQDELATAIADLVTAFDLAQKKSELAAQQLILISILVGWFCLCLLVAFIIWWQHRRLSKQKVVDTQHPDTSPRTF